MKLKLFLFFIFPFFCFSQNWEQTQKIVSPDRILKSPLQRIGYEIFGSSMDSNADFLAIGQADKVFLYNKINGQLNLIKTINKPDKGQGGSDFGISISLSSNVLVVGDYSERNDLNQENPIWYAGAIYIYEKNTGGINNWGFVKKIVAPTRSESSYFGFSVKISGDNLAVGAYGNDYDENEVNPMNSTGAIYIYQKNNGGNNNWGFVEKIVEPIRTSENNFGQTIELNNEYLIVGCPKYVENINGIFYSGAVYVYKIINNMILFESKILYQNGTHREFGSSIAMNSNILAISVIGPIEIANSTNEKILIYNKNINWDLKATLNEPLNLTNEASDYFGKCIKFSENKIFLGASYEDHDSQNDYMFPQAGAVFIFEMINNQPDNWEFVSKICANDRDKDDVFGSNLSIFQSSLYISSRNDKCIEIPNGLYETTGSVYSYDIQNNNFTFSEKLYNKDKVVDQNFGTSVSSDGIYTAIGAQKDFSNENGLDHIKDAGAVFIFKFLNGNWQKIKKIISPERAQADYFGSVVRLHNDNLAVGAYRKAIGSNYLAGKVYIFNKDFGGVDNWGLVKIISAFDYSSGDYFGASITINSNKLVIGATNKSIPPNAYSQGSVYIYEKDFGGVNNWGFVKKIIPSEISSDYLSFGNGISVNNDIISIGCPGLNASSGKVYLFKENLGGIKNWGLFKELTGNDTWNYDRFGQVVTSSNDFLFVGAPNEGDNFPNPILKTNMGAIYIFGRNYGGIDNWGQIKKVIPNDRNANDNFGSRISYSNNNLYVSSIQNDLDFNLINFKSNAGAVYIFEENNGGIGYWGQKSKLTPSERNSDDNFGNSISSFGNKLLVGTFGDDEDEENNNFILNSGSAYFFNIGTTCTTTKSGNWNDPTVWSCGVVPTNLDDVIIASGHEITLPDNYKGQANNIENNGNLIFGQNAVLNLAGQ